jgi:hypothetical protein
MVFMGVDMAGAVFSLLSLAFRDHFDVTASITYLCVVVCGTFASAMPPHHAN